MSSTQRLFKALVPLAALAFVAIFVFGGGATNSASAATITVVVGQTNGGGATGVNQFNAAAITITAGDTVTWNSALDNRSHDVVAYAEAVPGTPDWTSVVLRSGTANTTFSRVFSTVGVYTYYCSLHVARADAAPGVVDANIGLGEMVGKVTVQASATATPRPNTVTVEMTNFSYAPKDLTVRAGDTVRWVNNSSTPHTTTSSGNWDSSIVASGRSFERTFNSTGTFNYLCDLHPGQTGTITVQQDVSPTATTKAVVTPTAPAATPSVLATAPAALAAAAPARAAARGAITVDVAMQDYLFSPATATIAVGDTIRWVNKGNAPHNTTADGGAWSSKQLMNTGETFSFTFKSAGTYTYKCTLHPGQNGTIVVNTVAEGTLLPGAGDGDGDSGRIIRMLLATALGLAGFCAVSASLWARRPI